MFPRYVAATDFGYIRQHIPPLLQDWIMRCFHVAGIRLSITAALLLSQTKVRLVPRHQSKLNAFMRSHLCLLLIASIFLTGCANTPEAKIERVRKYVSKRPFNEWPAIYEKLERKGDISPLVRKQWTDAWSIENKKQEDARIAHEKEQRRLLAEREKEQRRLAAERKRIWDSLTPAQKMDFELRQQQLAQQQAMMAQQQANMAYQAEAQRRANVAAALSNFQQGLQNQEMINAYDRRSRAMSQPVNVNVNGNINHNFNGGYVQPYSRPWYSY